MEIKSYKDLLVWKNGIEISKEAYKIANQLPKEEIFGLSSQIKRSSVSIPSNIAEGRGRNTRKDFVQFLHIAQGSLLELETQIILVSEIYPLIKIQNINKIMEEEKKMLSVMISKLKANSQQLKA